MQAETFFITGANRGIGLALVREALQRGHTVIGTARNAARAQELAASLASAGDRFRAIVLEVTAEASVAAALLGGDFPTIDVLINNAAVFPEEGDEKLEELQLAHLSEAFETNVVGVARVTRALLPRLRRSSRPRIVNISSAVGSIWRKNTSEYYAYATSKAALNMLSRSMACELKKEGITLVAVTPGWVKTEMGGSSAPLQPEESARALVELCGHLQLEQAGGFLERDGEPSRAAW